MYINDLICRPSPGPGAQLVPRELQGQWSHTQGNGSEDRAWCEPIGKTPLSRSQHYILDTLNYYTKLFYYGTIRQQAIARTPAKWSAYRISSVIVVFVDLVF
jgi:hypothetical protein